MLKLKNLVAAWLLAAALAALPGSLAAQSNPGLTKGQVLTAGQWNALFAGKQDVLGYTPLNVAGGILSGRLVTAPPGASTAGLNLTPGTTPASPSNGDLWVTSAGIYAQINGSTILLTGGSSGSFAGTSPITVTFPAGIVTYACATCGVTGSPLSQFAATTSSQLAGVISDETGSGPLVFATGPSVSALVVTGSFTATGLVPLTSLAAQASNSVLVNATGGAASPTAQTMAACIGASNALQWVTNTGFTCQAIVAAAGSIAVGTTSITGGSIGNIFYHAAGNLLGELTTTGSGTIVALAASPAFTGTPTFAGSSSGTTGLVASAVASGTLTLPAATDTLVGRATTDTLTNKTLTSPIMTNPVLGVASATSLAIGGCTIGANAFCATGTAAISSTLTSAAHTITSASAAALAVGLNGATNPAFLVDASTGSSATGISVKSAAAAAGVAIAVISSGTNEALTINAKGSGTITFGSVSTGAIIHTTATTLSAALTYGGVTLSNAVTGTGNMVLSASPTFTGTIAAAAANFSGAVTSAAHTITSASASALAVGLNGATNPAFVVDASTASSATGISVKSAAAAAGVAIAAISSGTNENLTLDAKGSGTIVVGATSTGAITLTRATTLSAALTYGGVTLSNSVTGTGSMVLSAAPTITGNVTLQGVTSTGATGTGNIVFASNPSVSNLTVTTGFTATGLVTYAALNSSAIASTANYLAGTSSVIVPASVIYTSETTTTFGATTTFDFATFINTAVTLTANITTQTLSGVMAGKAGSIRFIQGGAGSYTTVWNSIFKFAGGATPTLSTAVGAIDLLFFSCTSATLCYASLSKDMR